MSPAIAAYKVLQPAKDLLEQTWAAAIAAVEQEFAAVTAELSRSAREKQALTEFLQRLQAERVQVVNALHTSRTELGQCTLGYFYFCSALVLRRGWRTGVLNFQNERRVRIHLERRLAEMSQVTS